MNGEVKLRQRSSSPESSACMTKTHVAAYPARSEALKRQRALQTATRLANPALLTTFAYLFYRAWSGISYSARPKAHATLAGDAWVRWMFFGVELGFACRFFDHSDSP